MDCMIIFVTVCNSKFFPLVLRILFQVIDLSRVSQDLADLSSDAGLVMIEGMVRPIYSVGK